MTNQQARLFLLHRHGLIGPKRYRGKAGVLEFVKSVGSVQFDPVDICGRSPEIVLQSRVASYKKSALDELLYKDRALVDFFDKNLCIFPVEYWPHLVNSPTKGGYASAYDARGGDAVEKLRPIILRLIRERGSVSSKDIPADEGSKTWQWSAMASLSRVALESMYFRGELVIHHKIGSIKSYAVAKDHIPPHLYGAADPFEDEKARLTWIVLRRIGAVGMLWNRGSDAFLGTEINAEARSAAFSELLQAGKIFAVDVDGIKGPLYIRESERPMLDDVVAGVALKDRAEFIAPLDNFIWDRRLIKALFGFSYGWEIYTPAVQRKYGAYTLPFLYGSGFAGRADMGRDGGALVVKDYWPEHGVKHTKRLMGAFMECARRFATFNGCESVRLEGGAKMFT